MKPVACVAASLLLPVLAAQGAPPQLRLHPLLDGLRDDVGGDLGKLATTAIGKEAAKVGLDLTKPGNPVAVCAYEQERLFYVFYKVTEEAFGDRAWVTSASRRPSARGARTAPLPTRRSRGRSRRSRRSPAR